MIKRYVIKVAIAAALVQNFTGTVGVAHAAEAAPAVTAAAEQPITIDPKHFYLFHADNVTPDIFKADLFYCMALGREIRGYAPPVATSGGGLLGALVGAAVGAAIQAKQASTDRKRKGRFAMRICMAQYGYTRYAAPTADWKDAPDWGDLIKDDTIKAEDTRLNKIIAFATGPKPQSGELEK